MAWFQKYSKIELEKLPDIMSHVRGQFVVTEKVHGANFSVHADATGVYFGKRSGILDDDENFYSYKSQKLDGVLAASAAKLYKMLQSVEGRRRYLGDRFADQVFDRVSVYGELFGGSYPHADVQPVYVQQKNETTQLQPVQAGVWYSPQLQFMGFDLLLHPSQASSVSSSTTTPSTTPTPTTTTTTTTTPTTTTTTTPTTTLTTSATSTTSTTSTPLTSTTATSTLLTSTSASTSISTPLTPTTSITSTSTPVTSTTPTTPSTSTTSTTPTTPTQPMYVDFMAARAACEAAGVLFAAPLQVGSLSECLLYSERFDSTLPARFGLPPLEIANLAEGIVVRAAVERVPSKKSKGKANRAMCKIKIQEFSEIAYNNTDWRSSKSGTKAFDAKAQVLECELLSLVTENRLNNVLSKQGRIDRSDKEGCKRALQALKQDAIEDLAGVMEEEEVITLDSLPPALAKKFDTACKQIVYTHVANQTKVNTPTKQMLS